MTTPLVIRRVVAPRPDPSPVVLIPTRAQVDAGVRMVDALDGQLPGNARRLRDAAVAALWSVRCTYALAMLPATMTRTETVAVRLTDPGGQYRGYALWRDGRAIGGMLDGRMVGVTAVRRAVEAQMSGSGQSGEGDG